MLTISSLGGSSLKVSGAGRTFVVFPDKPQKDTLNFLPSPEENPTPDTISWPGEYDVGGIVVRGIGHLEGQKVSYAINADDVRFAFPSSPLDDWHDEDIERLGDVDVLVLPAEDPKRCQTLLDEVDPRMLFIVPAADGTLHPDVLKLCGAADKEHVKEYKMKGSMPAEGREVLVFKA